jgi:hypothetical protein
MPTNAIPGAGAQAALACPASGLSNFSQIATIQISGKFAAN